MTQARNLFQFGIPPMQAERFSDIAARRHKWSQETFGDVGPVGPLEHLVEEAQEAMDRPTDAEEYADCMFLLLDALDRQSAFTLDEFLDAMEAKLEVLAKRDWPAAKDGAKCNHKGSSFKPAEIPDGVVTVNGKEHRTDTRGALVPINLVKPRDLLQDETARKIIGYAIALSNQVSRFKAHVAEDISLFEEILAMEYNAKIGGPRGNKTITSYDGLFKVSVRTAEKYEFGPELQTAKALVDECVSEWADGARDELKVFVTEAFQVNQEGKVSRSALLRLKKWNIEDERWSRAIQAIKDAEREVGSATYFHCHRRASTDASWEAITIDLAKA